MESITIMPPTMKAISLWEPWASLIRTGAKTFETRSWPTPYRGPLLICAAKGGLSRNDLASYLCRGDFQGGLAPLIGKPMHLPVGGWAGVKAEDLSFGKAVCIVNLVDCRPTSKIMLGEIENQASFGDYSPGRFAWQLTMINNAFKPFDVVGKQGLFEVDGEFIERMSQP